MAIDDNANYTLTGAQVKDLAQRVKAGGGGSVTKYYIDSDYIFCSDCTTTCEICDSPQGTAVPKATLFSAIKSGTVMIVANWSGVDYESATVVDGWMDSGTLKFTICGSSSADGTIAIMQVESTATDGEYDFNGYSVVSNDATLTIQHNGTTVQTFTANSSTNKTANVETIYADAIQSTSALTPPVQTNMIADGAITSAKLSTTDLIPEVVNSSTYQEAWKFPDGKLICFGGKYNGYDITGSYEGSYFATTGSNLSSIFAVPFIDTPQVTVTLQYNSGLLGFNLTSVSTTGFSGYIWKSQSKSNVGITVRYIAIGRWK